MTRRLHRSRTDTVIGGVAAGLAEYLNADPALVRIAWAILIPLTGGAALLAYIVAWIVVPEAPKPSAAPADGDAEAVAAAPVEPATEDARAAGGGENRAGLIVGLGLVVVGLWFLLRQYLPDFDWSLVWPVVLIGVGAAILVATLRGRREG